MKDLSDVIKKALKEVKTKISKMVEEKKTGKITYTTDHTAITIDKELLRNAAEKKAELDIALRQVKIADEQYKPLRAKILEQLPGGEQDKIDVVIDGIQIKKSFQIRGAGALNEEKLIELAKKKRILSKLTKKITVIDQEAVLMALHDGLITYEDYVDCLKEGNVIPTLDVEFKESPQSSADQKAEQDAAI